MNWRFFGHVLFAPWRRPTRLQRFVSFAALLLLVAAVFGAYSPTSAAYEIMIGALGLTVLGGALLDIWRERRFISRVKLVLPVLRGEVGIDDLPPDMQEEVKMNLAWLTLNKPNK